MLPYWPWWAWWLVLAAVPLAALAWALTELRRWSEWHHGYLGVLLVAAGALLLWRAPWPAVRALGAAVGLFGLVCLVDDAQAHVRQALDPAFPRSGVRGFRDAEFSPLHRWAHRIGLI